MLATDINFMFGVLLEEAKKTGGAVIERFFSFLFLFLQKQGTEFQVRNINTMWGDGVILNDYASKQMSGMVKDYYKQRWKLYLSKIEKLEANYVQEVYEMEVAFANHSKREQIRPTGDSLTLVSKALDKYAKGKVNKKNYAYFKGGVKRNRGVGLLANVIVKDAIRPSRRSCIRLGQREVGRWS